MHDRKSNRIASAAFELCVEFSKHRLGVFACDNSIAGAYGVVSALPNRAINTNLACWLEDLMPRNMATSQFFGWKDEATPAAAAMVAFEHRPDGRKKVPMPSETADAVTAYVVERNTLLTMALKLLPEKSYGARRVRQDLKAWDRIKALVEASGVPTP